MPPELATNLAAEQNGPIVSDSGSDGGVAIDAVQEEPPAESGHGVAAQLDIEMGDEQAQGGQDHDVALGIDWENQPPRDWSRRRSQSVSDADTKLSDPEVKARFDSVWNRYGS